MGSLFNVVIPIRSHELRLRLLENDILNTLAVPVEAPATNRKSAVFETMIIARDKSVMKLADGDEPEGIPARDIPLPGDKHTVFAYHMEGSSGQLLLQLTRDTMKLSRAGGDSEDKPRKGSASSTGSKASLDTDSVNSLDPNKGKRGSGGSVGSAGSAASSGSSSLEESGITELIDSQFLEKHLEDVLVEFSLLAAAWETSIDGKFSRIIFSVNEAKADTIINQLHALGVGKKYDSTLSVCATTVFTHQAAPQLRKASTTASETELIAADKGKWNSFVESIKARLTVAQVVQNVKANSIMTFDFIVMLIVAAIIAALGLLESSPVNLIASMLVSPLMGPIMAFTFGAMIRDTSLIKTGLYVEVCGLLLCLMIGFLFGIFLQLKLYRGPWADADPWPTVEMSSRGHYGALIVGASVAIPSGAGVALSILAGNAGSLVGVAISASLLPPCVNCGIFYGLALVLACQETANGNNPFSVSCDEHIGSVGENEHLKNHNNRYCNNALREYAIRGSISLSLTLLNILLIFITGIIVLKIKEVAPYTTRHAYERFWKHDLKQARAYNKDHDGDDSLLSELADDPKLLEEVDQDFVFNQVKNRGMYREENVILTVKEKISRPAIAHKPSEKKAGGWWFSSKSKADTEANKRPSADANKKHLVAFEDKKGAKSTKGKK